MGASFHIPKTLAYRLHFAPLPRKRNSFVVISVVDWALSQVTGSKSQSLFSTYPTNHCMLVPALRTCNEKKKANMHAHNPFRRKARPSKRGKNRKSCGPMSSLLVCNGPHKSGPSPPPHTGGPGNDAVCRRSTARVHVQPPVPKQACGARLRLTVALLLFIYRETGQMFG
jgi:hypothetical protein